MKRFLQALVLLAALGLGLFWVMTAPVPVPQADFKVADANLENGKLLFNAGGCISCHAAPDARDVPSGGTPLKTPIGTLYPPNLTPDEETGLGRWQFYQFQAAMQKGLSPDGSNLIPAFPYGSYRSMKLQDVADLWGYLRSLPPVKNAVPPHEVVGLGLVRRGLTFWKMLALQDGLWVPDATQSAAWNRGAYLVNGPGHCQECHTPRTLFMALDGARAFRGGPHPEGKGTVPSLHGLVERQRYKDAADLVLAFQNGEAYGYEHMSSGGMGEVQSNLSKLPEDDLKAIAEYLLSLK
ncbi:MAG: cytochrome c [Alphaproteobacteria bacterium]|nr:cytochrome c [Alphaproteobacteria bacterium]